VATQLNAFHKWGEGNMFGLYAQHTLDFDYTPYVPAMQAASTPDAVNANTSSLGASIDAAFSPDGRLFVAERAGAIRIVRDGRLSTAPAVPLDDGWTAGGNGLLAIAIDPQFLRTHFVYVIYTAASRSGGSSPI